MRVWRLRCEQLIGRESEKQAAGGTFSGRQLRHDLLFPRFDSENMSDDVEVTSEEWYNSLEDEGAV